MREIKFRLALLFSIACLVLLVSCGGVSEAKYKEIQMKQTQLETQYASIQEKQAQLESEYSSIKDRLMGEVNSLEGELDTTKSDYQMVLEQNKELRDKLQAYRDTGITVHRATELPRVARGEAWSNRGSVSLQNNEQASDPSFAELVSFLRSDKTDLATYSSGYPGGFSDILCGWFAEALHNNAEDAGVRAAFVLAGFDNVLSPSHALNAFTTSDKGLVFIDCTGDPLNPIPLVNGQPFIRVPSPPPPPGMWTVTYTIGDTGNCDTIAYLEKGKPIGYINVGLPYGLTYSDYEQWQQDVEEMRGSFNSASKSWELSIIASESDKTLGSFFQPSEETVSSITIYW